MGPSYSLETIYGVVATTAIIKMATSVMSVSTFLESAAMLCVVFDVEKVLSAVTMAVTVTDWCLSLAS